MSVYLNALLMLAAVLGGIVVLARVLQAARGGRPMSFRPGKILGGPAAPRRLAVEEALVVDGKRRLLLVRCEDRRVLLMTGGPADLVVMVLPTPAETGA